MSAVFFPASGFYGQHGTSLCYTGDRRWYVSSHHRRTLTPWAPCNLCCATSATYLWGSEQSSTFLSVCFCYVICQTVDFFFDLLDVATKDVSFSHQSEQLAESLQGLSSGIVRLYVRERPPVCRISCLCVFVDRLQCSVYQGQSTTPSSVCSAVPRHQWRLLGWPQLYRLPHQSNCNSGLATVANVVRLQASFMIVFIYLSF